MYNSGDFIYQKGSKSTHFFVVRRGKVWFMQSSEKHSSYPFMEVDSFFGEFDLFEGTTRRYTVVAKSFMVVYAIKKKDFLNIFTENEFRIPFLMSMIERLETFQKSDRECSRAVRRLVRVEDKMRDIQIEAKKDLELKIIRSKTKSKEKGWYDTMKKEQK